MMRDVRMHPVLRLIRLPNCLMMGLAVVVGAAMVAGWDGLRNYALKLIVGAAAGFLLTASSMALNDYVDREIDAINDPTKPIPSGAITPGQALMISGLTLLGGLLLSFLINIPCLVMAAFSWILAASYSLWGKRTGIPGNLMVSSCVVAPFVYGGLIASGSWDLRLWAFTSMVFLSNTAREITKGIADVAGDRAHGVKTLAVRYGERVAAWVAAILYSLAVAISVIPPSMAIVSPYYVPVIAVADLGFTKSTVELLKEPSRRRALKVKKEVLLWMLLGLIGFLLGAL